MNVTQSALKLYCYQAVDAYLSGGSCLPGFVIIENSQSAADQAAKAIWRTLQDREWPTFAEAYHPAAVLGIGSDIRIMLPGDYDSSPVFGTVGNDLQYESLIRDPDSYRKTVRKL